MYEETSKYQMSHINKHIATQPYIFFLQAMTTLYY